MHPGSLEVILKYQYTLKLTLGFKVCIKVDHFQHFKQNSRFFLHNIFHNITVSVWNNIDDDDYFHHPWEGRILPCFASLLFALHVLYKAVGTFTAKDSLPSWWLLLRGPVWAPAAPEYWFHMSQGCYAIFSLIQHDKLLWGSLYIASAFGLRNKNASNFYFSLLFGPINICQCSGDVWSRANQGMRHARRISWAKASRGPYCHHICSMHHIWCQKITFKSSSPFNHGYFMT